MKEPLSVYVHVPFCLRRCAYCSFITYCEREKDIPRYTEALINEMKLRPIENSTIQTVYFGGGTPNLLPPSSIFTLIKTLQFEYQFLPDCEITMEVNPSSINMKTLLSLKQSGINRLSLGVQSFHEHDLAILGRLHNANEAVESIKMAQKAGFDDISLDLIYGVPGRKISEWRQIVSQAIRTGVQHLSLYGLTLEEGTSLYEQIKQGKLAPLDDEQQACEYEIATDILADSSFQQYEISNWSLPGYYSRHNNAYWIRTPYIGLGVAAHSFHGNKRIANTDNLDEYLDSLSRNTLPCKSIESIEPLTALSEGIILGLRLNKGVSRSTFLFSYDIDIYERFKTQIEECISYNLLEKLNDSIRLTRRGRLLANEVFWRFLV
ncbi:MAG: radical SAM family heme chaperone HemW [Dehalococcoidia bacterium]|nr:radical SAM family heme chaperone HemW [Dehalococcoidia bacterium]